MSRHSRRAYLGTIVGLGSLAVAGCLGDDDDSADGVGSDIFDWVPDSYAVDDEPMVTTAVDINAAANEFPQELYDDLELDPFAEELGIEVEDIDTMVTAQTGMRFAIVLEGSFDIDAMEDHLETPDGAETYEGYTMVTEGTYADDSAIVSSFDAQEPIDARDGRADRAVDTMAFFDTALDDFAGAPIQSYGTDPEDDQSFTGMSMSPAGGSEIEVVAHAYFEDAEAAQASYEEDEDDYLDDIDEGEIDSVEVEDNVIVVTATTDVDDAL